MKTRMILFSICLIINQTAIADTLMVIESSEGTLTTWGNDKYIRANMKQAVNSETPSGPEGDMFGMLKTKKMYLIVDKEKILIDLSNPMPMANYPGMAEMGNMNKPPQIKVSYTNKRKGKVIAGLETTQYDFIAEGKKCFDVFLTKNKAYSKIIQDFDSLESAEGDTDGGLCEQAEIQQDSDLAKQFGQPVKMIDANGKITMELKKFKTNTTAPKNYLALPKGYQVMTIMDAMSKAMKDGTIKYNQ